VRKIAGHPLKPNEERRLIADRYTVQHTLGEGGMGTIYRVLDGVTGMELALKSLRLDNHTGSDVLMTQFQREYHTLKQLSHPRIIRVYDFGFAAGSPYYTMELLDGKDIRELAPLNSDRACALLRDIASSLAIIHSRKLVYRDLSPRNVRCTSDGRAKLLDFGALTPIGVPSHIIGTPAFVPPEAIYGQPLNQRADLYSLGALAYWLLTGSPPFEVSQLHELRDAWRSRPTLPSALVQGVPEALSALIMSLLSQSPTGRPQHAGEVIDKLGAIAQLPPEHDLGVVHAYLTTPELVGRDEEVFRKAVVRATRGRGSALLVRAQPGGGSTRLLDACVLEATLVGALVARVTPSALFGGPFAALQSVIEQWADALAGPSAERLRELTATAARGTDSDEGSHARIASGILALARERALLLAVDDAQRIDAASVAVFALLARASGAHKLLVCASLPATLELRESISLRMLVDATERVELRAWTLLQTEALLRSLFGSAASVPLLADRVHRVALGNPRDTMQLAQHLIDADVVRHQAGAWSLPTTLDEVALPCDMEQAQRRVVDTLSQDCRVLAATLALAPDLKQWVIGDCSRLSPDALPLLDALIRQGVLVQRGARIAFRHRGFAAALIDALDPALRRELQLRLVALHEASDRHALAIAYHLHQAGESDACLQTLRSWLATENDERLAAHWAELLDAVLTASERYPLTALERHRIRGVLVQHAAVLAPEYGRHGELSFEQLRHDTGLAYWDEYPELEPAARIGRCLERAQALHQATPEQQRGLSPVDAVRELAVLVRSLTSVYARTLAADKLLGLAAWLAPLCSLAPAIQLLHELTLTSSDRAVREKRVAHRFLDFAARFEQPLYGVTDFVRLSAASICLYCAAMDEAKQGKASALSRLALLEKTEGFAALAWHVRMLSHIYNGRSAEAARCRERMELLVIEHNRPITLLAMSVLYEGWAYEMCEDLTGLKNALEQVEQEAQRFPGWLPWAVLYRGDVNRLRGDLNAAYACYEQANAMTAPGRHQVWPHAAERRVGALRQLGRLSESVALGRATVQYGEAEDLEPVNMLRLYIALALSEAQAGSCDTAAQHIALALRCAQHEGIAGVALGIVHEAGARIAIHAGDAVAFEQASQAAARCLLSGDNPALTAKYERLLQEARAAGLTQATTRPPQCRRPSRFSRGSPRSVTTHSALRWC
jgi:tetratricopeptide (TPR) repeat protein